MSKELPKMYQSKINKDIKNMKKVYSTLDRTTTEESTNKYPSISIDKKINDIFTSGNFVYKADVTIITDTDTLKKRIVARNQNNLITLDNEYIPISIIRDIHK